MKAKNLILAFAPLIVFTLGSHLVGPRLIGWAAAASALLALIVLLIGLKQGVKLITAASVVVFGGLAVIALVGGSSGQAFVDTYGTGVCAMIIGGLMLISVVTVPFTEQYARAEVPKQFWATPGFKAINKKISLTWGGAVLGIGVSRLAYGLITGALGVQLGLVLGLVLNWGVPILLIIAALNTTKKVAAAADQQAPPTATGATP